MQGCDLLFGIPARRGTRRSRFSHAGKTLDPPPGTDLAQVDVFVDQHEIRKGLADRGHRGLPALKRHRLIHRSIVSSAQCSRDMFVPGQPLIDQFLFGWIDRAVRLRTRLHPELMAFGVFEGFARAQVANHRVIDVQVSQNPSGVIHRVIIGLQAHLLFIEIGHQFCAIIDVLLPAEQQTFDQCGLSHGIAPGVRGLSVEALLYRGGLMTYPWSADGPMRPNGQLSEIGNMRQTLVAIFMFGVCLPMLGCGANQNKPRTVTSDRHISIIDYDKLTTLLKDPKLKPVLVDVRIDKTAYESEHIPGAIHIPLQDLRADNPLLAGAPLVIVYSAGRSDSLSTAAAKKLLRYKMAVVEFRAGLSEWRRQQKMAPQK